MDNFDSGKVIKMVIVIGLLCAAVGIMTTIKQKSEKTLSDYADSQTLAESVSGDNAEADFDASGNSDSNTNISSDSKTGSESASDSNATASDNSNSDTNASISSKSGMTEEEYDSFYYLDISDENLSSLNILYYNCDHQIVSGQTTCSCDYAELFLNLFYCLYKQEYEFEDVETYNTGKDDINEFRADNITFCDENKIYINPLYNPVVSINDDNTILVNPEVAADYSDRLLTFPYKIDSEDYAYRLLTENGFNWGGNRNGKAKDYSCFSINK